MRHFKQNLQCSGAAREGYIGGMSPGNRLNVVDAEMLWCVFKLYK